MIVTSLNGRSGVYRSLRVGLDNREELYHDV